MSLKPPKLDSKSPDYPEQLQHHLDLIWQAIDSLKGAGGRTIRLHGPLDMMGLPLLNTAPSVPKVHKSSHQEGGYDELDVSNLDGLLADAQTPLLMTPVVRGGAMLGDVFSLVAEVLTLTLKTGWGLQNYNDEGELALKQQDVLTAIATADATDLPEVLILANEMKAMINSIIQDLKDAEILSSWQGWFHKYYFHSNYFATGYFADAT